MQAVPLLGGPLAQIDCIAVDRQGTLAAVGQYAYPHEGVALVDLAGGVVRWRVDWAYSTADMVVALAFASDKIWLALSDGRLRCYAISDGRVLAERESPTRDSVVAVHLARDASHAVVRSQRDETPGWSAPVATITSSDDLVAVEGAAKVADADALMGAIIEANPAIDRFHQDQPFTMAHSPDGKMALVSHGDAAELRLRTSGRPVADVLTLPKGSRPLSGWFADDGKRCWIGTRSGQLFACAL